MAEKLNIDLDELERAYRSGISPLRKIADDFGISEAVIRKYAKKYDWARDLSAKIKLKADEIVREASVRESVRKTTGKRTEAEIIKSTAELQAGAILLESSEIIRLSDIAKGFEEELDNNPRDSESKLLDLEKRARILKALTEVREKIINLRRRNLNINDNANGDADKVDTSKDYNRELSPIDAYKRMIHGS